MYNPPYFSPSHPPLYRMPIVGDMVWIQIEALQPDVPAVITRIADNEDPHSIVWLTAWGVERTERIEKVPFGNERGHWHWPVRQPDKELPDAAN